MAARGCAGSPVRVTEYPGTDLLTSLRTDNLIVAAEPGKPLSRACPHDGIAARALPRSWLLSMRGAPIGASTRRVPRSCLAIVLAALSLAACGPAGFCSGVSAGALERGAPEPPTGAAGPGLERFDALIHFGHAQGDRDHDCVAGRGPVLAVLTRAALHEAQPFGDVPPEDQAASVAAPGDVRSRQHLQQRHTNEPSSDEASQGEVGHRDDFHILELNHILGLNPSRGLNPLPTLDHLGLQGPRTSRVALPCAICGRPRSLLHSYSPPGPAALGLSGPSCPFISPGRPPPPGGSGQGRASHETSH